ncbi:hypothetical protein Bbelb_074370 [Branchiostoma belcheri]|nr:hypothetical protein Bbelb_074370 [Branchiostoma belcheri]
MSFLRIFRIGSQVWDMYKNYKRRSTTVNTHRRAEPPSTTPKAYSGNPTARAISYNKNNNMSPNSIVEDESVPPATHVDKAEHRNVGKSVTTGGHDNQAGANGTGSKIYVACRIENYHVTVTDRTT